MVMKIPLLLMPFLAPVVIDWVLVGLGLIGTMGSVGLGSDGVGEVA